jgi:putative DNA primase/helicase
MAEEDLEDAEETNVGNGPEDYRQAEWLAQRLDDTWKFDHTAGQWHHFDGTRWAPDKTKQAHKAIHNVVLKALGKDRVAESEQKRLFALLQWPAQERALKALSTFKDYGTDGDEWDTEVNLMGTPSGVIDLRKNSLIPATPEQNVTKTTKVAFSPITGPDDMDRVAPVFMRVMREWMSGDEDMVYWLLFWYGASLFGMSPEEKFLLMTGIGRNGKGALKESVIFSCGDYADELDPSLYMRSKHGGARSNEARADLIKLKGLRITFFSEPGGGVFNEELLKAHTGNDRIAARALYSNNIQTWEATHSINFLTNELPSIEDVGPSMGERVMVADFRNAYEGAAMDTSLKGRGGKLWQEREGILSILVWAASIWYSRWSSGKGGLILPERVKEQSKAFMERNDPIANWLNDRAERDKDGRVMSQVAYDNYLQWHTSSGAPGDPMSQVRFAMLLQKKGFEKSRTKFGAQWHGVRLLGAMALAERGADEDEEP